MSIVGFAVIAFRRENGRNIDTKVDILLYFLLRAKS